MPTRINWGNVYVLKAWEPTLTHVHLSSDVVAGRAADTWTNPSGNLVTIVHNASDPYAVDETAIDTLEGKDPGPAIARRPGSAPRGTGR